jgi:hypothetical protein
VKKHNVLSLLIVFIISAIFAPVIQARAGSDAVVISCIVDKLSISEGDTVVVVITVTNPKQYELTNLDIHYEGKDFTVVEEPSAPSTILPFSSYKGVWTLKSLGVGKQNLVFSVAYSWQNKETHNEIVTVSTEQVEITPTVSFRWPDYIIPLIIGIFTSQAVTLINNWMNEGKERKKQEEQARGLLLAVLQSAKGAIENQAKASFGLWEEGIIKANLFPAIYRLSALLKLPDMPKRLADLSISIADYNQRLDNNNVTEAIRTAILSDIKVLISALDYGA